MRTDSGVRWLAALLVALLLAGAGAWFAGRWRGGRTIHFRLDDAGGIEPGTAIALAGVRAGVVTRIGLDSEKLPGPDGRLRPHPRAHVEARLVPGAARILNPGEWEVVVTLSPIPGFKGDIAFLPRQDPEEADGAVWRGRVKSAVADRVDEAFDAFVGKALGLVRGAPADGDGEGGGGEGDAAAASLPFSLPAFASGDGGQTALLSWLLDEAQIKHFDSLLENASRLARVAADRADNAPGDGLGALVLGAEAQGHFLRALADLSAAAAQLRATLGEDGGLLRLALAEDERGRVAALLASLDEIGRRAREIDPAPVNDGLVSFRETLRTLEAATARFGALVTGPDGQPGELERQLARLPAQMETVYRAVERTSKSSEEVLLQTTEVLRKANQTVSLFNQLLTGLKRSWFFKGAFAETLRYEDLAPFLVPPEAGPPGAARPDFEPPPPTTLTTPTTPTPAPDTEGLP